MPIVEPEDILIYPPPVPRKRRVEKSRDAHDAASGDKIPPASPSNKAADQSSPHQPQHSTSSFTPINYKSQGAEESTMAGAGSSDSAPRRGRPPGSKNKQPSKSSLKVPKIEVAIPVPPQVPSPSYPTYQCDWDACQAQLHDIKTLERHIIKVHISGQTGCRWHGCPNAMRRYTGVELRKHMQLAHVQPLAWKFGDGPSVNGTGEDAGTSRLSVEVTS